MRAPLFRNIAESCNVWWRIKRTLSPGLVNAAAADASEEEALLNAASQFAQVRDLSAATSYPTGIFRALAILHSPRIEPAYGADVDCSYCAGGPLGRDDRETRACNVAVEKRKWRGERRTKRENKGARGQRIFGDERKKSRRTHCRSSIASLARIYGGAIIFAERDEPRIRRCSIYLDIKVYLEVRFLFRCFCGLWSVWM